MAGVVYGPRTWSMSRDAEGHREYKIIHQVRCTSKADGPAVVLTTPGLPQPGQPWVIGNEIDLWAYCKADAKVTPVLDDGEPNYYWLVEQTFSTKPNRKSQDDRQFENPLLEKPKVSGSTSKYTEEATHDRFGLAILSSSHELIQGSAVEFDKGRDIVNVEQNVAVLDLAVCRAMRNTVNSVPIWGCPRRTVKLSDFTWERKYYGPGFIYYTRKFSFDIREDGFDRWVMDQGQKALNGHLDTTTRLWVLDNIDGEPPDPANPLHFKRFTDPEGHAMKIPLNGRGLPAYVTATITKRFISLSNANLNRPLYKSTWWAPYLPYEEYDAMFRGPQAYLRGNVVLSGSGINRAVYVAKVNSPAEDPPSSDWITLSGLPVERGIYSTATTYAKGDVVSDVNSSATVGYRYVQKYNESNFLLLGLPTVL